MKKIFISALIAATAATSLFAGNNNNQAQGTGWGVCRNPIIKNGAGVQKTFEWTGRPHGGEGCDNGKKENGNGTQKQEGNLCQDVYWVYNESASKTGIATLTTNANKLKTNKKYTYFLQVSKDPYFKNDVSSYALTPRACHDNSGKGINNQTLNYTLGAGEEIFATVTVVSCKDGEPIDAKTACSDFEVAFDMEYPEDVKDILPLGIIGAPNEATCSNGDAKGIEVYSGGQKISGVTAQIGVPSASKVTFTVPNQDGIDYNNLKVKLTCGDGKSQPIGCTGGKKLQTNSQGYFCPSGEEMIFSEGSTTEEEYEYQVRPAYIKQTSGEPGLLYAEYPYRSDASASDDNEPNMKHLQVSKNNPNIIVGQSPNNDEYKDQLDTKNVYAFQAYDGATDPKPVETGYNSIADLAIISTMHGKSTTSPVGIMCGTSTCALSKLDIKNGASTKDSIYTHRANYGTGNHAFIEFDNVGKTSLYGVDSSFAQKSNQKNACVPNSTSNVKNADGLIGCDVGFISKDGKNYIEFHTYRPAVFKVVYKLFNSDPNPTYGSKNFTYKHAINESNYNFENGKIEVNALAIGASKYSFEANTPLSLYDAKNFKEANYVEAKGSVLSPVVTYTGETSRKLTEKLTVSMKISEKNYGLFDITGAAKPVVVNDGKADISREAESFVFGNSKGVYAINYPANSLQQDTALIIDNTNISATDFDTNSLQAQKASAASSAIDSITFVDVAMLSPNMDKAIIKGNNAKAEVYLAGICKGKNGVCKEILGNNVPGYSNEKTFSYSVISDNYKDKNTNPAQVFDYENASHKETKNSFDIVSVGNNVKVVKVLLRGENAKNYCDVIRGCKYLGKDSSGKEQYGMEFTAGAETAKTWHGKGAEQGKTAVDKQNMHGKNKRLGE